MQTPLLDVSFLEEDYPLEYSQHIDLVSYPRHIPELGLLAGILEMAYRDLNPYTSTFDRKSALRWFRSKVVPEEFPEFTFVEVCSYLHLSTVQINFIFKKVNEAEDYEQRRTDKFQEERKSSGARTCQLVKGAGHSFSPENTAIFRYGRNIGCSSAAGASEFPY